MREARKRGRKGAREEGKEKRRDGGNEREKRERGIIIIILAIITTTILTMVHYILPRDVHQIDLCNSYNNGLYDS